MTRKNSRREQHLQGFCPENMTANELGRSIIDIVWEKLVFSSKVSWGVEDTLKGRPMARGDADTKCTQ